MGVEELDQLGEVGERAGQSVDLIDDDHVDPKTANIIKELLERWSVYRAAGIAAVVVVGPDQLPALVGLALDVGFRRLPLIVERVELLLQAMLGRNTSVDGAAQSQFGLLCSHCETAFLLSRRFVVQASVISPVAARATLSEPPS